MVLLYDGCLDGFFTAVFNIRDYGKESVTIRPEKDYIPELFDETMKVTTRSADARRIREGIEKRMGKNGLVTITQAFLSDRPGREDTIRRFIFKGMRKGAPLFEDLSDSDALEIMEMSRKTMREYQRFLGLIRFKKLSTGEYYAPFKPDTNLLPLLGPHFAGRFPDQAWMIHDRKRRTALVHLEGSFDMIDLEDLSGLPEEAGREMDSLKDEDSWAELWRIYHKKIGVEERTNPRLQRQFLPLKHRKYLPEFPD